MENSKPHLSKLISCVDLLPSLTETARRLLALDMDSAQGENELIEIVRSDPPLLARLIGMANSPLFRPSGRRVSSVNEAVLLLGLARAKSIAFSVAAMSVFDTERKGRLNLVELMEHSLDVAVVMREISARITHRPYPHDDEAMLAGLTHEIGYMVLAFLDREASDALHVRIGANPERDILEIETEVLGMSHSEIGARLAEYWSLPDEIVLAIRHHHAPHAVDALAHPLPLIANLAERIVTSIQLGRQIDILDAEWESVGVGPSGVVSLFAFLSGLFELNEPIPA